jgi:hypothetical protein
MPLICAVVGLAAYLPQCEYPFVYDDVFIVSRNPAVAGGSWADWLTQPYWPPDIQTDPVYRPVTTLSLRLNYALFGDEPLGFRVTNALLHAICSAVVALLAMRLWRGAAVWAGLIAGLLFAVHPVHVEAVALVVGRGELLAGLFTLWLVYRHVGYLHGPRAPSVRYHVLTALLFLLALGAKEHAVVALPAIVCLDIWGRRPRADRAPLRRRVDALARSHYLGLVLALAVFLFARWCLFGGRTTLPTDQVDPMGNPLAGAPLMTAASTALAMLFLAARLMVVPVGLCPIWSVGGFELPETPVRLDVLAGAVLAVAVVIVSLVGLRRKWTLAVPLSLAGLSLILPCHFIPAANWLFAERWLYLPSAFFVLLIAGLGRYRPAVPLAAVIAVALFGATWQYQKNWASNYDLFESVVARHPNSSHGLIGYCHELRDREGIMAAEPYVARLVQQHPQSHRTWYYQALLMDALGRPRETLEAINRYTQLNLNPLPRDLAEAGERAQRRLRSNAAGTVNER